MTCRPRSTSSGNTSTLLFKDMISIRPGIIGGRKAKCEINAAKRASASESESIKFATDK